MKDIDKYAYASQLRMVNPHQKVLFCFLTLGLCVCTSSILLFIVVSGLMAYITICKGKVSIKLYQKLMRIPLAFLMLSLITIVFEFAKEPALFLGFIKVGSLYIGFTKASLQTVTILFFKVFACVSCLYFLCLSTPMTDILRVLEKLRCPLLLIEMMSLIYRFIFVLIDTATTIQIAQTARLGYKNFRVALKSCGMLMSTLLVRTLKINNDLYVALECRGYTGQLSVLNEDCYRDISYFKLLGVELILIGIVIGEKWMF